VSSLRVVLGCGDVLRIFLILRRSHLLYFLACEVTLLRLLCIVALVRLLNRFDVLLTNIMTLFWGKIRTSSIALIFTGWIWGSYLGRLTTGSIVAALDLHVGCVMLFSIVFFLV
jgi:hypothetical protein